MTVSVYEGLPGSGKSYDAVRKVLSNLELKRRVITNIDGMQKESQRLTIQHYLDLDDNEIDKLLIYLDDDKIQKFWEYTTTGDLVVVDEAQNFFNSRDWQKDSNRQIGKWASEHRKSGNDVIFITQDMVHIESSVRRVVEWVYRYKKLNMFGGAVQKKYIRFVYYGQNSEPLGKKVCTYDSKIFKCYSSFFVDNTKEIGIEKPHNVLKHPIFFFIPVVLIAFVYFFMHSSFMTGDLFGSKKVMSSVEKKEQKIPDHKIKQSVSMSSFLPPAVGEALPVTQVEEKKFVGMVNGKQIFSTKGIIYLK